MANKYEKITMTNKERILSISKELGLTHIGSNLSCLPVLEEIYSIKKEGDIVGLSGAHAHLAHLMFTDPDNAGELIKKDIHCNRESGCDISGGSLGHAGGILLGMALANPGKTHYLIITDGSAQEGSEWEALNLIRKLKVKNIKVYANLNGYTALAKEDRDNLSKRLKAFLPSIEIRYTDNGLPELDGINGHYDKL